MSEGEVFALIRSIKKPQFRPILGLALAVAFAVVTGTPLPASADTLLLEITGVATNTACLVVHPPAAEVTSGVYDLFMTTNLSLNATNWLWTRRTLPGQTAISVYGVPPNMGFFVLGTMLDSNGDGVTDAYTHLVGLADNSDLDGDGVSNIDEMRQGRNPQVFGAVADANDVARLDVFTVLR